MTNHAAKYDVVALSGVALVILPDHHCTAAIRFLMVPMARLSACHRSRGCRPCRIARITDAHRLLAELDTPPSLAAAIRFDAWLHNEAQANDADRVPVKRIYQYGPNCVQDTRSLCAARAILEERGRARMEEVGLGRVVKINSALLDDRE
jgi:hypothetical protein